MARVKKITKHVNLGLPGWMKDGMDEVALRKGTDASSLYRDVTERYLESEGITDPNKINIEFVKKK
jgi:hypothetical protein